MYIEKYGAQDEMMINSITDFSSNKKRKYNTMAEDVVKRKNIAKSIKNEKDHLQFVQGLISIMKVNDAKKWSDRSRIKNDLIAKLENCTRDEFNASTDDFYVGRSLSQERKITNDDNEDTNESRQVESTRVLNNNWVKMHFKKTFCDKLDEEPRK